MKIIAIIPLLLAPHLGSFPDYCLASGKFAISLSLSFSLLDIIEDVSLLQCLAAMLPLNRMDEDPGDDIAYRIWIGTIVTVVPATVITALRFIARTVSRVGLWWDDYTIAVALVRFLWHFLEETDSLTGSR